MSFKNISILIILSLSLITCKKNDSAKGYTFNGIVVSYPLRQPLAGIKVHLITSKLNIDTDIDSSHWQIFYADTAANTPLVIIDSTISDANGRFSFTYISINNYPEINNGGSGYDPTYRTTLYNPNLTRVFTGRFGNPNIDSVLVDIPSYLRINMHKLSTAFTNDTLFEKRDFNYLFSPNEIPLRKIRSAQTGQSNSTVLDTYSYKQSNKVNIEWRYYRNGLQKSGLQTVNLIPNDTTKVDIYY